MVLVNVMVKKKMNMTYQEAGSQRNKGLKERKCKLVSQYTCHAHCTRSVFHPHADFRQTEYRV